MSSVLTSCCNILDEFGNTYRPQGFWNRKSPTEFQALHSKLSVSASKVISMLETPSVSNPAEERVCQYLTTMIGNMQPNKLRLFMRFVTGASVCIASKIIVTTNNVGGLARRPIAHTCDSTLELTVPYSHERIYADFEVMCVKFNMTNVRSQYVMNNVQTACTSHFLQTACTICLCTELSPDCMHNNYACAQSACLTFSKLYAHYACAQSA